MLRVFPFAGIQFMSHEQYKHWLRPTSQPADEPLDPARRFIAGSMAGFTATALTYPLDLMRARFAVQIQRRQYRGLWHAFRTVWQTEGGRTLFHGLPPTLLGIVPYAGVSFFTFETLKETLRRARHEDHLTAPERLFCGACAGLAGQVSTYPLDVVRRRMQTDGFLGSEPGVVAPRRYRGVLDTLRQVYRNEGLRRGLYRGISMNFIKGPVAVGVSFTTFDLLKRYWRELLQRAEAPP